MNKYSISFMQGMYQQKHNDFEQQYQTLFDGLTRQIFTAAATLLKAAGNTVHEIDLSADPLIVGVYEPALQRLPLLYNILIGDDAVSVRVELREGYRLLAEFETFDFLDHLSILRIIESEIHEIAGSRSQE